MLKVVKDIGVNVDAAVGVLVSVKIMNNLCRFGRLKMLFNINCQNANRKCFGSYKTQSLNSLFN